MDHGSVGHVGVVWVMVGWGAMGHGWGGVVHGRGGWVI